jgi:hypothetical protein
MRQLEITEGGAACARNAGATLNMARAATRCERGARFEWIVLTMHVFDIPPQQGL